MNLFPCTNPACDYVFSTKDVAKSRVLRCPRCGQEIQLRAGATAPGRPAAPRTPPPAPAKPHAPLAARPPTPQPRQAPPVPPVPPRGVKAAVPIPGPAQPPSAPVRTAVPLPPQPSAPAEPQYAGDDNPLGSFGESGTGPVFQESSEAPRS